MSLRDRPTVADVDLLSLWDPIFIYEKYIITSDPSSLLPRFRPSSPQKKPQWHYFVSKNSRLWADNIISDALDTLESCFHSLDFVLLSEEQERMITILRLYRSSLKLPKTLASNASKVSSKDQVLSGLMSMLRSTSATFVREGSELVFAKTLEDWSNYVDKLEPLCLFDSDRSQLASLGQYFLECASGTPHQHLKARALRTMLRFSVAAGSFHFLLGSTLLALENPDVLTDELVNTVSSLDFTAFVHQSHLLVCSSFVGQSRNVWPIALQSPLLQPIPSLRTSEMLFNSITCDNSGHLFIFDENIQSIIDVGSGYFETRQGHEYGSVRVESLVVGLGCVGSDLFVLRNTTSGDALLCVERLSHPEGSTESHLEEREAVLFDISSLPISESTMMCGGDGLHLFFVDSATLFVCEPKVRTSSRANKTTYELVVIRTVSLAPPQSRDVADLLPLGPTSWNILCNGHFLCAVCSDLTDDEIAFATITWDALTGAAVEIQDAIFTKTMLGRTSCYDCETNSIWTYSSYGCRVSVVSNNRGIQPNHEVHARLLKRPAALQDVLPFMESLALSEFPRLSKRLFNTNLHPPHTPMRPFAVDSSPASIDLLTKHLNPNEISHQGGLSLLRILEVYLFWLQRRDGEKVQHPAARAVLLSYLEQAGLPSEVRLQAAACLGTGWNILTNNTKEKLDTLASILGSFGDNNPSLMAPPREETISSCDSFLSSLYSSHDLSSSVQAFEVLGLSFDADLHPQSKAVVFALLRLMDANPPDSVTNSHLIRIFSACLNSAVAASEISAPDAVAFETVLLIVRTTLQYVSEISKDLSDTASCTTVSLLLPIFCDICKSASASDLSQQLAELFFPLVMDLTKRVNELNIRESDLEDMLPLGLDAPAIPEVRVAETAHPISARDLADFIIHIPGAACLCIEFDPLSELSVVGSYIQMYSDPERNLRVGPAMTGSNFPERLLIPGDTICIHLHYPVDIESLTGGTTTSGSSSAQSSAMDWGFRCTIVDWKFRVPPSPISIPLPPLIRTLSDCTTALGHLISCATEPPPTLQRASASTDDMEKKFNNEIRKHGDVDVALAAFQGDEAIVQVGKLIRSPLFRDGLLSNRAKLHTIVEELVRWSAESAGSTSTAIGKFMAWLLPQIHGGGAPPHGQLEKLDAAILAASLHVHSQKETLELVRGAITSGSFSNLRSLLMDVTIIQMLRSCRSAAIAKVQQSTQQRNASAGFSSPSSEVMNLRKGRFYVEVCKQMIERALFVLKRPVEEDPTKCLSVPAAFEQVCTFVSSPIPLDSISSVIASAQTLIENFTSAIKMRTEIQAAIPIQLLFRFIRCISSWFTRRLLSSAMSSIPSILSDFSAGARRETISQLHAAMVRGSSTLKPRVETPSTPSAWGVYLMVTIPALGAVLDVTRNPQSYALATSFLGRLISASNAPIVLESAVLTQQKLIGTFVAQTSRDVAPTAIMAVIGRMAREKDPSETAPYKEAASWIIGGLRKIISDGATPFAKTRRLLTCLIGLIQASTAAVEECRQPHSIRLLIDASEGSLLADPISQVLLFRLLRTVLAEVDPAMLVPPSDSSSAETTKSTTIESALMGLGMLEAVETSRPLSPRPPPSSEMAPIISDPLSPVPFALERMSTAVMFQPLPCHFSFQATAGPVSIDESGLLVGHLPEEGDGVAIARTDAFIPDSVSVFYFEVTVQDPGSMGALAIGFFPPEPVPLLGMPGWHNGSYGYHADDGNKFCYKWEGSGASYGPRWIAKDSVVGALFNRSEGTISFTCNGTSLGVAFANVTGRLCPAVSVHAGACLRANFGQVPFKSRPKSLSATTHEHHPGENPMAHAKANVIYLARFLHAKNPVWQTAINTFIVDSLNAASQTLQTPSRGSTPRKHTETHQEIEILEKAYLAAQIMGGYVPTLRLGAFVASVDSRDEGYICQMSSTHVKLLKERKESAQDQKLPFDVTVTELSRVTPVEASQFDIDSFLSVLDDVCNSLAALVAFSSKAARSELAPLLSSIRTAISTSMQGFFAHPKVISKRKVKSVLLPTLARVSMEKIARATSLPELKQLVPSAVFVEFSGNIPFSPLFKKKRYLAAIRQHISLLIAESILQRKPTRRRRSSRQMPTKSNAAESEFRKALQEGGFTFADVRQLREAFVMFDLDQDGYISLDEFLVVSNATGNTAKVEELTQAFRKMDEDGSGRVDFLEFVRFSAQAKKQASRRPRPDAHHHFACASCGMSPITGVRYSSAVRVDENLCSNCFVSSSPELTSGSQRTRYKRQWNNVFMKITEPFPLRSLASREALDFAYAPKEEQLPLLDDLYKGVKQPKSKRHEGVPCSRCGKDTIVGTRFASLTSKDENFCADCEALEVHQNPRLMTIVIEFPLPKGALDRHKTPILPSSLYSTSSQSASLRLLSIRPGSVVTVARKDETEFGFWAPDMDDTIGMTGIVEAIDMIEELILVRFLDVQRETSRSHWYSVNCLEAPKKSAIPTAFFLSSEMSGAKTVAMALENDIAILTCRSALCKAIRSAQEHLKPSKFRGFVDDALERGKVIAELLKHLFTDALLTVNPESENYRVVMSDDALSTLSALKSLFETGADPSSSMVETAQEWSCSVLVSAEKRKWKRCKLSISSKGVFVTRKDGEAVFTSANVNAKTITSPHETDSKKHSIQLELRTKEPNSVVFISFKTSEEADLAKKAVRAASKASTSSSWSAAKSAPENIISWCTSALSAPSVESKSTFLSFESAHPYSPATAFRRYACIPNASHLLISFDPRSHTQAGVDFLTFWKDAGLRQPIAVFHGKGALSFPAIVIEGNEFWLSFETDPASSAGSYWGYSFTVVSLVPFVSPSEEPCSVGPLVATQFISSLMRSSYGINSQLCKPLIDALWHLCTVQGDLSSLHTRAACALQHVIQASTFSGENQEISNLLSLLEKEVSLCFEAEKQSVGYSFSLRTKALCQLAVCLVAAKYADESDPDAKQKAGKVSASPKPGRRPTVTFSLTPKWPLPARAMEIVSRVLSARLDGHTFSPDLVKRAFTSERFRMKHSMSVEESTHPHAPNADLSGTVSFRGARELLIEFDPRCFFVPHGAILLFESSAGQEIARFEENIFPHTYRMPVDSFSWKFISNRSYPEWGFRFSVIPSFDRKIVAERAHRLDALFRVASETQNRWDLSMDYQLVRWVNATVSPVMMHSDASKPTFSPESLFFHASDCDFSTLQLYLPNAVDRDAVEARLEIIKYLNNKITKCLSMIDFQQTGSLGTAADLIVRARSIIFQRVKNEWVSAVLQESSTNLLRPRVRLRRRLQRNARPDSKLYIQAMDQILNIDPARLQRNDRAFEVLFEDEGAQDIGGPYREVLSQICYEIQNVPDLFIPTPNGKAGVGDDQDKVVPNPSLSAEAIRSLDFVGRLIGISIRTKSPLELSWPSLIWKRLVGLEPTLEDLEGVDYFAARLIRSLSRTGFDLALTEQEFNEAMADQVFAATSFDDRQVPLLPGGESRPITWSDRHVFSDKLLQFKLGELREHCEIIKRGIARIIPVDILQIYTAAELESLVCGVRSIDASLLMAHTKYGAGMDPSSVLIKWFWRVVRAFSDEQRQKLLQFISGRTRLPSNQQWATEFTINPFPLARQGVSPDRYLPTSHTCFFSLDLPSYSSEDVLRQRLLYAITNCIDMDADFNVRPRSYS